MEAMSVHNQPRLIHSVYTLTYLLEIKGQMVK